MRHVDDDALTLLALGEQQPDSAQAEHLAVCERCREELAVLTGIVAAGRAGGPLEAPPERVWDRIAAQVGATEDPSDEPRPTTDPARADTVRGAATPGSARPSGSRPAGRRERPRTGRRMLTRAAWLAAGLATGIAGTLVAVQWQDSPATPTPVATAELEPLPGWQEAGTARIEEVDGRLVLHVEVTGDVPDGYREVWLLDESVSQLVSVGLLVDGEGTFDLPEGLDLGELVIVDVSHEPFDGDPAHSGDSIVRGRLDT